VLLRPHLDMNRSTTVRDKLRAAVRQGEPACHVCMGAHGPINYDAHHLDPLSFTIDHIVPLFAGGEDVIENVAAAHRQCNRAKGASVPTSQAITFVTARTW
jgi:5-methylcytosine-specific restriction endonuclease McrA